MHPSKRINLYVYKFLGSINKGVYLCGMNAQELLRKLGAEIDAEHGKGGHIGLRLNGRVSYLPMHGKKEIGKGLLHSILKQLGLTERDLR